MHESIAERPMYERSYEPDGIAHRAVPRQWSGLALLGRILMAAIFIVSGFAKLTDPAGAAGYMTNAGIAHADTLVYVAGAAELAGGLALAVGFLSRLAGVGLIVLLCLFNYFMHNFWALPAAEAKTQMVQFMKNLAIMGGLFMVVAMGPGRFSIDGLMRRPRSPRAASRSR